MTLRKLTAAAAFTLAAGLALPAVASADDRYDRDRGDRGRYDRSYRSSDRGRSYDRGYRSYDRGYRSYDRRYRYSRPYRVYRPAPRYYYYDPYVYAPYYRPYRDYRYYDRGPGLHLHLDF